jgi:hypothetical protein
VLFLPLLALLASVQAVNRARDDGSLELFLSHPIGRGAYLAGVAGVRFAALALPLAAVMLALAVEAAWVHGQAIPWVFFGRALGVCVALLAAYVGVGLATSVLVRHPAKAMTLVFGVWIASAALLDFAGIALLLQWRVPAPAVFVLAVANPVQAARMALLSAAEPTLATFGPVGFYMANHVGAEALFALGIVWPWTIGIVGWLVAWRSFRSHGRWAAPCTRGRRCRPPCWRPRRLRTCSCSPRCPRRSIRPRALVRALYLLSHGHQMTGGSR